MRVLFCGGSRKAPSWQMRGVQIAAQRHNWNARNDPSPDDIAAHDIIVVVKRFTPRLVAKLARRRKIVVWDALDFWPQPKAGDTPLPQTAQAAIKMTRDHLHRLRPDAVIASNMRMVGDLMSIYRTRCIYHHARLDARHVELGKTLYYDGSEKHAAHWLDLIRGVAVNYGWDVKCGKPEDGAGGLLALRDYNTGLWLANRWKSNVKAANAIAYGLPLLGQPENGYLETLPEGYAIYFQNDSEARKAVARFCNRPVNVRNIKAEAYTVERAASEYEKLFNDLI